MNSPFFQNKIFKFFFGLVMVISLFLVPRLVLEEGEGTLSVPMKILLLFLFGILCVINILFIRRNKSDEPDLFDDDSEENPYDKRTVVQKIFDGIEGSTKTSAKYSGGVSAPFMLLMIAFVIVMIIVAWIVK